jgi:hypothetical protein
MMQDPECHCAYAASAPKLTSLPLEQVARNAVFKLPCLGQYIFILLISITAGSKLLYLCTQGATLQVNNNIMTKSGS